MIIATFFKHFQNFKRYIFERRDSLIDTLTQAYTLQRVIKNYHEIYHETFLHGLLKKYSECRKNAELENAEHV